MATLSSVILPAKRLADGSHKVRISLAHNGQTKYIVTDIVIESPKQLKKDSIVNHPNATYLSMKLRKIINGYHNILDSITSTECLTCAELIVLLKNNGKTERVSLQSAFEHMISLSTAKASSIMVYQYNWNIIKRAINTDMNIDSLSIAHILTLEKNLIQNKFKPSFMAGIFQLLKTVTNHAVKFDMVSFKKNPWIGFQRPRPEVRESWITVEQYKSIAALKIKQKVSLMWRDLFLLSFCLGGMNIADIIEIDWQNVLKTNVVMYKRKKATGAKRVPRTVKFTLQPEARELITNLLNTEQFQTLHHTTKLHSKTASLHKFIEKTRIQLGITNLTFYSARKLFSQIAFEQGVMTEVRDYLLGHSENINGSVNHHYVYVTPQMATDALRKVLDFIK